MGCGLTPALRDGGSVGSLTQGSTLHPTDEDLSAGTRTWGTQRSCDDQGFGVAGVGFVGWAASLGAGAAAGGGEVLRYMIFIVPPPQVPTCLPSASLSLATISRV